MRLLVTTQAVDLDDPVLGFFHRWLEEFSTRFDSIEVICLREGRHALPANVRVHSLGKTHQKTANSEQRTAKRFAYAVRFLALAWTLRKRYGAVFVHMNQEYVLLGGFFWKLLGKRIVLWRNHRMGSFATRIAAALSNAVCYTSPSAYVASYRNAVKMPIGIDTVRFKPPASPAPSHSILFLGRLDPVKKAEIFLEALELLKKEGVVVRADVYGDATDGNEAYAERLRVHFGGLADTTFYAGVPNEETPALYGTHDIYVNLTPSGSFDKTIGEALACGCAVICGNAAVRDVIPAPLFVRDISARSVAAAVRAALAYPAQERAKLAEHGRTYIEREHSLSLLTQQLLELFE
jgi:glycosyltransferase involved in cell wall biosynthesis